MWLWVEICVRNVTVLIWQRSSRSYDPIEDLLGAVPYKNGENDHIFHKFSEPQGFKRH